jgi:hypothetical protein
MRRAISTLLIFSFFIACCTCPASVSFSTTARGLFEDAFLFEEVLQRRTDMFVALIHGLTSFILRFARAPGFLPSFLSFVAHAAHFFKPASDYQQPS